ncbi:MAG: chloride channel protein [Acidobacteriota bacterium]
MAVLFDLSIRFMEQNVVARMAQLSGWQQVVYTLGIPMLGALVAGLLLYYFVPEARGNDIPQVKVAYEITDGRIPLKVVIGKFLIGTLSIGTGSSLGREGPTVHICSGIVSVLGSVVPISSRQLANLLTVGSAAGIAAAFNAPIAGITFTLEELVGDLSERIHLGSLIIACVIAAVIERSILGTHPVFEVPAYGLNNYSELLFYTLLGILGGFVSLVFTRSLLRLRHFFQHHAIVPVWARPAIGGFIVGLTALILLRFAGLRYRVSRHRGHLSSG